MSASRQKEIASALRQQIAGGRIRPGSRLPTRAALEARFQASSSTMQSVFDRLMADGMIESKGRAGTFVAERPPHLTNYALVLHGYSQESRYYHTLGRVATELSQSDRQIASYFHVSGWSTHGDRVRLEDDMAHQRLAGVIFGNDPYDLAKTPVVTMPDVPRVGIMSESRGPFPTVYPDLTQFRTRALECLAERGRRRIAFMFFGMPNQQDLGSTQADLARFGLTSRPEWMLLPYPTNPLSATYAAQLLCSLPADLRPDGLVINDDNLVEAATAGIHAAGLAAGELDVVGLCNFPDVPPSSVPFIRLGFDCRALLGHCVWAIDAQRRGEKPPHHVLLPPCFEAELSASANVPVSALIAPLASTLSHA